MGRVAFIGSYLWPDRSTVFSMNKVNIHSVNKIILSIVQLHIID
jgi:hypothetical protein